MTTLLVDVSNLAYRAHYVYSLSFEGRDTSVTYGVLRMLMSLAHEAHPTSIIMCFDGGKPLLRTKLVPTYKTNRTHDKDETFAEVIRQMAELHRILPHFGVLCVRRKGIEADDLMYHASRMLTDGVIVSNDEDMLQAVDDNTAVMRPGKKGNTFITLENFKEIAGVDPDNFLWAKALQGDSSDNIPGVWGIGPAIAAKIYATGRADFSVVNDKIRARANEWVGKYGANVMECINMQFDFYGARQALINTPWMPYEGKMVTRYCIDNAFASLMEAGSLGQTFGPLKQPMFITSGWRFPRVWDTARCPL